MKLMITRQHLTMLWGAAAGEPSQRPKSVANNALRARMKESSGVEHQR